MVFSHVTRECNKAAHMLAKEAVERYEEMCWLEETPDYIGSVILRECVGP
jgi:hypothetical protein